MKICLVNKIAKNSATSVLVSHVALNFRIIYVPYSFRKIMLMYFTCVLKERHYIKGQIKFIQNMKGSYSQNPW